MMKKLALDLQVKERLSLYAGEQKDVQARLSQVSQPSQMDPKVTSRLYRYTR